MSAQGSPEPWDTGRKKLLNPERVRQWRTLSGMLPYTVYVRQPELGGFHTCMKIEIAEWKIGEPIDDSVFVIPAGN